MTATNPRELYTRTAAAAASSQQGDEHLMRRLSGARLLAMAVALLAAAAALDADAVVRRRAWWLACALASSAFIALVIMHARTRRRHGAARARRSACAAGLARMTRDWTAMPPARWVPPLTGTKAALAHDLDVVGEVSLHRLLDVGNPTLGGARVLEWLLSEPPTPDVIRERAASVAALRDRPEALLAFGALSHAQRRVPSRGIDHFTAWTGGAATRGDRRLARLLTTLSLLLTLAIVAVLAVGNAAIGALSALLIAQATCAGVARSRLERDLLGVDDALTQLDDVLRSLRFVVSLEAVPGRLATVRGGLVGQRALAALGRLRRLLDWNGVRYSPLAHWSLNAAVGLDVHLWRGVLDWRERNARSASGWIDAVAEAEAHVALATLGFENPEWIEAQVHERTEAAALDARGVGHPLIAPDVLVRNDLRLESRGDVVVVSGSNMAGKTTFLRAVGLNGLLAQAGGPVCARELTIHRCRVRTSVRVEDDLGSGVSLFLAEAKRLQAIVGDAQDVARPPVLFLLDEILHGTNAEDRREAIRLILTRLTSAGAAGLVTTHDPTIARAVLHGADARQLHFRESLSADDGAVRMTFDYVARPGPATSRNALAILRMLGLS